MRRRAAALYRSIDARRPYRDFCQYEVPLPASRAWAGRPPSQGRPLGSGAAVLTVAPWHDSLGDIAAAQGTTAALTLGGLPTREIADPAHAGPDEVIVVGGGDLLTPAPSGTWNNTLLRYRVEGAHVLNGAGLVPDPTRPATEYAYLREYRLVSVRDHDAADYLSTTVDNVHVVPCLATVVPTLPWSTLVSLPGFTHLSGLEPGEFVLIHRHPDLTRVARSVAQPIVSLDMQAWEHHPWPVGGISVRTPSPVIGMTLAANAGLVLTRSLHLGIFALASGTAFAVLDGGDRQAQKCRSYMARAGAESSMTTEPRDLALLASSLANEVPAWSASEHQRAQSHAAHVVEAIGRTT